jgi:ankyrin repeat protein
MDTLSSLPVGLNNLYSRMILDIEDHRRDEAFNALRWLSCSLEPLSMSTLAEAAILRLGSSPFLPEDDRFARPRDLLPILNGLATIKKPPAGSDAVEMVFLVHQSLVDFLMSDQIRHTQAHQFAIDEQETERFLAESCIEYILYYSHSKAKQGTVSDFDRFPLLKYACKHWMNHARHWENGRRAAFESRMNDVEGVHIKELILTLLTDSDSLSCWLSVFDPEDPTKKPFTSPRSETTALLYAIRSGSLSTIRKLLESHADIATSNTFGRNPLHVAVEFRQTTIVRELFKTERARGLSGELVLNIALKQDASGRTPVLEAALSGDTALIDVFLQFTDAKRIGAATINGVPFAHYLAQVAESTILEQFLAFLRISGEKLDLKDAAGMTLLHHSVMSGNLSAATVIVKRGADINSQDENKDTPLHFAIRKNQDATRELLINAGADVTLMNSRRTSPLAESWAKKSLDWGSYKVDITKTGRMSHGVQAECHVLRKIEGSRSDGPDVSSTLKSLLDAPCR